jgi:hypothetical protein
MGLHEMPPTAVACIWAALPVRDRRALRAASRDMRAATNACVTRVTVGDGTSGVAAAELPRLSQRFPGLRELRFEPDGAGHLFRSLSKNFRYLRPALEALPPACCPAAERAGGPRESQHLYDPLVVAQLARLCPGLTRVDFGAAPGDCGHVGPALEALAAGCRGLACLDLQIGVGLNDGRLGGRVPRAAGAEAVAAAAAGLRRLGGGLRELSVMFAACERGSTAARTLLPSVLPSLTALSRLTVGGESGVVVGAPCGSLKRLVVTQGAPIGAALATIKGPLPGVTSLRLEHCSDR